LQVHIGIADEICNQNLEIFLPKKKRSEITESELKEYANKILTELRVETFDQEGSDWKSSWRRKKSKEI